MGGFGEVGCPDLGGIAASAGAAGDDDGDVAIAAGGDEVAFMGGAVDGVDDEVGIGLENGVGGFGGIENGVGENFAIGVDGADAMCEDVDFGFAEVGGEGGELAIDVGDADFVEIDEGKFAQAGSGEGFDGPGADAADADDADVTAAEFIEAGFGIEPGDATESQVKIGLSHAES